jgi:DNA-binding MarR family transcriptional regulator
MNEPKQQGDLFTALILEIFHLNALILGVGDRMAQPVGLTSARWQVLGIVEHGPVPVAHVARYMGLSRQTVQQTADGLERDGFIIYRENPHHRRAKLMQMTEQGERALAYVRVHQTVWAQQIGREHTVESLGQTLAVLRELRRQLEEDSSLSTSTRRIGNEAQPS